MRMPVKTNTFWLMEKNLAAIIIAPMQDARNALAEQLQSHFPHVQLVGQAGEAAHGFALIRRARPELVFVEAGLPDDNTSRILQEARCQEGAGIILSDHTGRAVPDYECDAAAFLLKPVERGNLAFALDRAAERLYYRQLEKQYAALRDQIQRMDAGEHYFQRVAFSNQEETAFIYLKDLIRIEARGNCSAVYAMNHPNCICVAINIGKFAERFRNVHFLFQTHRSHLVNLHYVKKLVKKEGGSLRVKTHNGGSDPEIPLSNRCREELVERLERLRWMG
jgi:two-component system, LytTR family, response regulator